MIVESNTISIDTLMELHKIGVYLEINDGKIRMFINAEEI